MAVSPARRAAYEVLMRVFEQDAYADRAFTAEASGLDPRDRALGLHQLRRVLELLGHGLAT